MVDDVPELGAEPELRLFRKVQVLVDPEVYVVGAWCLQVVPTSIGQRAQTGPDELCGRIVSHIGHNRTSIRPGKGRQW